MPNGDGFVPLHPSVAMNSQWETALSRYTHLAARLCRATVGRFYFASDLLSGAGFSNRFDNPLCPWEAALCAQALHAPAVLIVPDVSRETGFAAGTTAKAGTPGFFAGAALRTGDGAVFGVLYVLDDQPRTLSDEDRDAFAELAQSAAEQIDLLRTCFPSDDAHPMPDGGDCVITIDHTGRVRDWNLAAEHTFGFARGAVLGQPLAELIIPPRLRDSHYQGMAHYLETGSGPVLHRHTQITACRADGSEIAVELIIVPVYTAPDQPPFFTGYVRAVSGRPIQAAQAPEGLRGETCLLSEAEAAVSRLNASLVQANHALLQAYDTTIEGWARVLDLRDEETEGHSRRVTAVTVQLARRLGLGPCEQVHLRRGAILHDIGKMGVPDHILLKPGPLTPDEWTIMRRHPEYARDMLQSIEFLRPALDVPYCHHEKWDGTGYPRGLRGEEIPLAARIFSVVDVWDALRSDRPYRTAWPDDKVRAYLAEQSGRAFDPRVVRTFLAMIASESVAFL